MMCPMHCDHLKNVGGADRMSHNFVTNANSNDEHNHLFSKLLVQLKKNLSLLSRHANKKASHFLGHWAKYRLSYT